MVLPDEGMKGLDRSSARVHSEVAMEVLVLSENMDFIVHSRLALKSGHEWATSSRAFHRCPRWCCCEDHALEGRRTRAPFPRKRHSWHGIRTSASSLRVTLRPLTLKSYTHRRLSEHERSRPLLSVEEMRSCSDLWSWRGKNIIGIRTRKWLADTRNILGLTSGWIFFSKRFRDLAVVSGDAGCLRGRLTGFLGVDLDSWVAFIMTLIIFYFSMCSYSGHVYLGPSL